MSPRDLPALSLCGAAKPGIALRNFNDRALICAALVQRTWTRSQHFCEILRAYTTCAFTLRRSARLADDEAPWERFLVRLLDLISRHEKRP
jgi:hypothetical protein